MDRRECRDIGEKAQTEPFKHPDIKRVVQEGLGKDADDAEQHDIERSRGW